MTSRDRSGAKDGQLTSLLKVKKGSAKRKRKDEDCYEKVASEENGRDRSTKHSKVSNSSFDPDNVIGEAKQRNSSASKRVTNEYVSKKGTKKTRSDSECGRKELLSRSAKTEATKKSREQWPYPRFDFKRNIRPPKKAKSTKVNDNTGVPLATGASESKAIMVFSDESSLTGLSDGPESEEEDEVFYGYNVRDSRVELEDSVDGQNPFGVPLPGSLPSCSQEVEALPPPNTSALIPLEDGIVESSLAEHHSMSEDGMFHSLIESEDGQSIRTFVPSPSTEYPNKQEHQCEIEDDVPLACLNSGLENSLATDPKDSDFNVPLQFVTQNDRQTSSELDPILAIHGLVDVSANELPVSMAPLEILGEDNPLEPIVSSTRGGSTYGRLKPDAAKKKTRKQKGAIDECVAKEPGAPGEIHPEKPNDVASLMDGVDPKSAAVKETIHDKKSIPVVDDLLLECGGVLDEQNIYANRSYIRPNVKLATVDTPNSQHASDHISAPFPLDTSLSTKKRQRWPIEMKQKLSAFSNDDCGQGEPSTTAFTDLSAKRTIKRKWSSLQSKSDRLHSSGKNEEVKTGCTFPFNPAPPPLSTPLGSPSLPVPSLQEAPFDAGTEPKKLPKKLILRGPKPPAEVVIKRTEGEQLKDPSDSDALLPTFKDFSSSAVTSTDRLTPDYVSQHNPTSDHQHVVSRTPDPVPSTSVSMARKISMATLLNLFNHAIYTIEDLEASSLKTEKMIAAPIDDGSRLLIAKAQPVKELEYKHPLPPDVKPKIWAQSRQEVCESFRWFRAYQSGIYFHDGMALGYLLSAFGSANDLFHHNGKLIVSHGGGKSKATATYHLDGQRSSSDQGETDLGVRSLIKCYNSKSRIVLLADDKYRLFPYDLQHYTYVVLGFYRVVCYWAEYEETVNDKNRCIKYKFAFEWCDEQGDPWWAVSKEPQNECTGVEGVFLAPGLANITYDADDAFSSSCRFCRKRSKIVYEGWTCFNPRCTQFCHRPENESSSPSASGMTYSAEFLRLRKLTTLPLDKNQWELRPDPPPTAETNDIITTKEFAKGWWCSRCNKLCCRERWESWYCSHCSNTIPIGRKIITLDEEEFRYQEETLKYKFDSVAEDSGIATKISRWRHGNDTGVLRTYVFPHENAQIHVIAGHPQVNGTANDLFHDYQSEAFSYDKGFFRRYPLQSHQLRGQMLSNYFSQNSGAPYKYIVDTNGTVPFDEAPVAVRSALDFIKFRASAALKKPVDFNEILSAAYLEEQKMSYHSDSEPGLGPVVSSLSLGSMALMHFRPMKKKGKMKKKVLSLVLRHGDVLVMDGAAIQDYYEHTVVPKNFRIAATARMIGIQNLTASVKRRASTCPPQRVNTSSS